MTTDERFDALEKTVGRQRITITVLVAVAAVMILPVNKLWAQAAEQDTTAAAVEDIDGEDREVRFTEAITARLGLGFNNMVSISDGVPSYDEGLAYMADMESPVSPVASLLLEGVYLANTDKNKTGDVFLHDGPTLTVSQANVGIKLTSPLLYVVGVIGYNRATTTPNDQFGVSITEKNIGAGAGVGLNFRRFFGEARLYHSRAAKCTYFLGIVGMQFP